MNVHNKAQTLVALQLVLEEYRYGAVSTIHLPSLLRTTLGLMESSKVVEGSADAEAMIEKTCKIFEGGKIFIVRFIITLTRTQLSLLCGILVPLFALILVEQREE